MKKAFYQLTFISSILYIISFAGCIKDDFVNKIPVAMAGEDQTVLLPATSVMLYGSGADQDGYITSYEWTWLSGPGPYAFENSFAATTIVKDLVEGRYVFKLKVTDNDGLSATDLVNIDVMDPDVDPCAGCWDY